MIDHALLSTMQNDNKHPQGFQPCFIKRLIVDASKLTPLERGEESGEEALNVSL